MYEIFNVRNDLGIPVQNRPAAGSPACDIRMIPPQGHYISFLQDLQAFFEKFYRDILVIIAVHIHTDRCIDADA